MRALPATLVLLVAMAACSGPEQDIQPTPLTMGELADLELDTRLELVRPLDDGPSFNAFLFAYEHSGLRLHALVAVPKMADTKLSATPVVLANHGYVPDPRRYGITAEGIDSRPGDYYRSIPELFTSRGFLVVMPDYRGHNSSDGFEQIDPQTDDSFLLYGEDVVALLAGISDLRRHQLGADLDNIFMWSHSMGGIVSMRVLLATDTVRASSFWSTMNVYSFAEHYSGIDGPVILQHSRDDSTTPVGNSEQIVAALSAIDHPHEFHVYDSADHLFDEMDRNTAADRDAEFFWSLVGATD